MWVLNVDKYLRLGYFIAANKYETNQLIINITITVNLRLAYTVKGKACLLNTHAILFAYLSSKCYSAGL